jgi:Lar family restriction alleviation protein
VNDKPCPFCGSTNLMKQSLSGNMQHGAHSWIHCEDCGAYGKWVDAPGGDAYAAWNTRPIEDALRAEIERLQRENAGLKWTIGSRFALSCTWCGLEAPYTAETYEAVLEQMNEHALHCEKDPHEAEIQRLRAALTEIRDTAKSWEGRDKAPYWNLGDIAAAALEKDNPAA